MPFHIDATSPFVRPVAFISALLCMRIDLSLKVSLTHADLGTDQRLLQQFWQARLRQCQRRDQTPSTLRICQPCTEELPSFLLRTTRRPGGLQWRTFLQCLIVHAALEWRIVMPPFTSTHTASNSCGRMSEFGCNSSRMLAKEVAAGLRGPVAGSRSIAMARK